MVMLQQMIVMFLMMAVGYLCYRKQILTEEVSRKVSAIVVKVANPCMILSSARISRCRERSWYRRLQSWS